MSDHQHSDPTKPNFVPLGRPTVLRKPGAPTREELHKKIGELTAHLDLLDQHLEIRDVRFLAYQLSALLKVVSDVGIISPEDLRLLILDHQVAALEAVAKAADQSAGIRIS